MIPIKQHSIIFAPMEGYTDPLYRRCIREQFPEWDLQYTDFLRIPSNQMFRPNHIVEHFGGDPKGLNNLQGEVLQILCPAHGMLEEHAELISSLGFQWLDFNLGCPSKTVNGHKGGSYLLQDLETLQSVLRRLRNSFKGTLTIKIRTGYNDSNEFDRILNIISESDIDGVTIHARTRAQQYHAPADWSFIKRAVNSLSIPVIGNGDIWSDQDAIRMIEQTGCYAVMAARGALKTPWMAQRYKNLVKGKIQVDALEERNHFIPKYFEHFFKLLQTEENIKPSTIHKRMKSLCRYIFDDYPDAESKKRDILRSADVDQFFQTVKNYFS